MQNALKQKIRLLVVDDSAFVRRSIIKMYERSDEIEVVEVAVNGEEAVEFTRKLRPDVVTLDVRMPVLDGLSALEIIMRECPTAVVMFSSLTGKGGEQTLKALELGAVDFIDKSRAGGLMNFISIANELTMKIQVASRVNVAKLGPGVVHPAPREPAPPPAPSANRSDGRVCSAHHPVQEAAVPAEPSANTTERRVGSAHHPVQEAAAAAEPSAKSSDGRVGPAHHPVREAAAPAEPSAKTSARKKANLLPQGEEAADGLDHHERVGASGSSREVSGGKGAGAAVAQTDVVAIGTSTGGPPALQKILSQLPADFPSPILIVQHMPQGFTSSLAARLDRNSALEVKEASDGECVVPGKAYIAPGGWHMRLRRQGGKLQVWLDPEPDGSLHRPSVDRLFESVASVCGLRSLAVVLTGMGRDGALGAQAIKEAGGGIVVEAEESAVVFGMPKAVIQAVPVDAVVPLPEVAQTLLRMA